MAAFETPATPDPPVIGPAPAPPAPAPTAATLPPLPPRAAARMRRALAAVAAARDADARIIALRRLVASVRPPHPTRARARRWLAALIVILGTHPEWLGGLRAAVLAEVETRAATRLLTDTGVLATEGMVAGIARRLGERFLPPAGAPDQLADLFAVLFAHGGDTAWLQALGVDDWARLVALVLHPEAAPPAADPGGVLVVAGGGAAPAPVAWPAGLRHDATQAVQILAHRLGALGLEPELLRNAPELERVESPFVAISEELLLLVRRWREQGLPVAAEAAIGTAAETDAETAGTATGTDAGTAPAAATHADLAHIEVLTEQAQALVRRIRRRTAARGASLGLGYLLTRLQQTLARLRLLLDTLRPGAAAIDTLPPLLAELSAASARRHSLRALTAETSELLALRVTANAGQHGEKYIASSRAEYRSVFLSAFGGGLIIPLMALVKIHLHDLPVAPFLHGLVYGLNYGLGFVLIFLLHFTVATKQPAMTASFLAHQFDASEKKAETRAEAMAEILTRTLRSQVAAVAGNILPAFAIGLGLAWLAHRQGHDLLTVEAAHHLLADVSPLGPAPFYAAIAGVWLFLSGQISGFVDNWVVYGNVERRLHLHPWVLRLVAEDRAQQGAAWLAPKLGGLVGNFVFGLMLGLTGVFGAFLGLPLDIRHVAFSAANTGYASGELGAGLMASALALAIGGTLLIGLVNLLVSFGLALSVALRARQVGLGVAMQGVGANLGRRLRRQPGQFFYPPPDPPDPAATADDSEAATAGRA